MEHSNTVNELEQLSDLENIYNEYIEKKGSKPSFISHWDPNLHYRKKIAEKMVFPNQLPFVGYNYSKRITNKYDLLKRIDIKKEMGITLSPNGTISLNLVFNFLKSQNINKIISLTPSYYIITNLSKINNIPIENLSWERFIEENSYELQDSTDNIIDENTLIYITNPIYSTGYYLDEIFNKLSNILKNNPWIILDESLSLRTSSIMKYFTNNSKVISIYSPHKTICVNAYKFSFIVHDKKFSSYFEQWTDVVYGGLGRESISAMEHYLSENFLDMEKYILTEATKNKNLLINKVKDSSIYFDENTSGHFISIHYPNIKASIGNDLKKLKEMVFNSGLSFIPNIRNSARSNGTFSYRINLLRIDEKSLGGIVRLHSYLTSFK